MEKELNKVNEHYRKNYFNEEIAERIKARVHQDIKDVDMIQPEKQRHTLAMKISYVIAACLVLFGLFIGSAFVSPAMAEVASKLPFLNKIFEQKPIGMALYEELKEKGYNISGTGYQVDGKLYSVVVSGSDEYYNQVKDELKNVTEDLISSRGYDDYKVEVIKEKVPDTNEDPANDPRLRDSELVMDVLSEIVPKLQQQGYKIDRSGAGAGFPSPDSEELRVELNIEDTETRTEEIEAAILEGIKTLDINREITVKFYPFNVQEKEIEGKWLDNVLPVIWEGMLNQKEFKARGGAYSYKNGTMNIIIKTTVDKSDNDASELANKIEIAINEFLKSDELKDIVSDTPYNIIVRDKDGKDIN